ncbi:DUF2867 domain-containing protein [Variovorax terrae]|uniref:DUF2867 domain-containing protein n=1 Tax=Variovorax terrae TaxID=2923278 RepID=A0A9X1VVK3_9BURK|nr:DUF2867 domain-containing protein [Variovorax terrae]MCJ0763974.1 DUF2867 domain-containing protein [Variovorax terrae]
MDRRWVGAAYFRDSYRAPMHRSDAGAVDLFLGIFAHRPTWIRVILMIRNAAASLCGLDAPTAAEVMNPVFKARYAVGDRIGAWPIFALTDNELVAGRDNRHLDFRVSVLRMVDGGTASVVVSTVCVVHNTFGKVYLFCIVPFHSWGVRRLISNAVTSGRL